MKKRLPKSGAPGPGETEDGDGHQLEVERADPQQPGHGRTEQNPRRPFLLGLQVHARGLEDVTALVGALLRLVQGEQSQAERDAGERHEQPVAPVVADGDDEAEDEDADGLRQRVGEVVPAEDAPASLGGIGVGQVRVVHRVVDAGAHRGSQVEEGEPPDVRGDRHEGSRNRRRRAGPRRPPPCGCRGRPRGRAGPPTAAATPAR